MAPQAAACIQTVEQRAHQKLGAQPAIGLQFAQNAEGKRMALNSFHGRPHDLRTNIHGPDPALRPLVDNDFSRQQGGERLFRLLLRYRPVQQGRNTVFRSPRERGQGFYALRHGLRVGEEKAPGQRCVHRAQKLLRRHVLRQFHLEPLAVAGRARGQRRGEGKLRVRIEARGICQRHLRSAKRPVERPLHIQMGDKAHRLSLMIYRKHPHSDPQSIRCSPAGNPAS